MPYIGNTPADKFLTLAKQSFSTSATTSYTLDSAVSSTQDIALFINNVRQSPVDAYSVSGTALTLTSATAGTDEMYCVYLGKTVGTVNPPNDSVGLDQLSATGTPSSSNYLRGDNSWASAGTTINNNADNRVITGSGTANTLEGESNLTYDGTTFQLSQASPIFKVLPTTNGNDGVIELCGRSTDGSPTENRTRIKGEAEGSTANTKMTFHTEDSSDVNERMSISSDGIVKVNSKLVIDNSVVAAFKLNIEAGGNNESGIVINDKDAASNFPFLSMRRSGSVIGSIERNGSNDSVNYETTSDYRLKENEENISDGIERLKQLKPYKFNWKSNPSGDKVDGFFAHEVQTVVPEAISRTKDAVDENNEIIPQGIDQSKLVPLLTSALQEAITKIETLETKVTALENK
jgi:hypothetical protein